MTILEAEAPPAPVWERTWQSGYVHHFQALYRIDGQSNGVGVRVTVQVDTMYPDKQSYATAEVFNGAMWNSVSGLPPQLMKCITYRANNVAAGFSLDGLARDVSLLLRDAQFAWDYRVYGV